VLLSINYSQCSRLANLAVFLKFVGPFVGRNYNHLSKTKYRYNPESLSYEEVKLSTKDKIFRGVLVVLPAILLILAGGIIALWVFQTPKEKELKAENIRLKQDHARMFNDLSKKAAFSNRLLTNIKERDNNLLRVTYGMDSYPEHLRKLGVGGSDRFANYSNDDLVTYVAQQIDSLERTLYAQSKSFDEIEALAMQKKDMLNAVPSIQPIANKDLTRIASGFGMRVHPVYHIAKMHTGIDLTADVGTDIYSAGDGVVEKVDWMGGYGKIVIINHGFGYKTYYAHCHDFNCKVGQKVKRGEVIAYVGNTGVSTGPHLHYEVRKKIKDVDTGRFYYKPVDPVHYFYNDLTPEEYERVIEIASKATYALS